MIMNKGELIKGYLKKYPNMSKHSLAAKIYNENKLKFTDKETVRASIKYYTGANGKAGLKTLATKDFLSIEKVTLKMNLPDPIIEDDYEIIKIHGKCGLIMSDIHIPFHDKKALSLAINYASKYPLDFIMLLGDIADCFELSSFDREPDLVRFKDEVIMVQDFLKELKRLFPKTKIYYKFGNHEKRFDAYMQKKAPEIFDLEGLRLDTIFKLAEIGINYIPEDRIVDLNGLILLHGHEYKNAITSPANPARTLFLRTKAISLCGHYHQESDHSEPTINGEVLATWSIGCLCHLHPKYMPLNKWVHGFAMYFQEPDGFWRIENKKIIENHVV